MTGDPETAAVEEPIAAEAVQEESKQRCLGEFLGVEAKRRGKERELEPVYVEARHQGMLIDLIDLVTERAEEGKYDGTEEAIEELTGGVVSEQELSEIKNVVKNRLTAHGSCAAVAARDDSACKALTSEWKDGGLICYMVYGIYGLMAREVLIGEKTCEEALAGFNQFKK